jgi:hypothetical protein
MAAPLEFSVDLDLTLAGQDKFGLPRLYPGDTVRWRFQVRDENEASVNLTGYTISVTARRRPQDATAVLHRRSSDPIAGASPASNEIVIDDQTSENPVAYTGTGWFEIRFLPLAAEETELLAAVGQSYFDIVLEAPDGTETTFAEGLLEIPRRMTRVADVP